MTFLHNLHVLKYLCDNVNGPYYLPIRIMQNCEVGWSKASVSHRKGDFSNCFSIGDLKHSVAQKVGELSVQHRQQGISLSYCLVNVRTIVFRKRTIFFFYERGEYMTIF